MKSGGSSSRWLRRQHADPFVRQARERGYRGRAAFKLEELHRRYRIFRPGQRVLELGAAPGAWSQVALRHIGSSADSGVGSAGGSAGKSADGCVQGPAESIAGGSAGNSPASSAGTSAGDLAGRHLGVDLLDIEPLPGAQFLRGDFLDAQVQRRIERWVGDGVDLILSDMAPNMSGIKVADQLRAMDLAETCARLAERWLRPGGALLCKVFVGEGWDELLGQLRASYTKVSVHKPRSSRAHSRETYCYALDLRERPAISCE